MKKQDLKNGMILEMRNGDRYLLVNDIMRDFDSYIELNSYSDDLTYKPNTYFDIVKIYKDSKFYSLTTIFKDEYLTLIWERKEIKLTDREIEVLKALKVLGNKYIARDRNSSLYVSENKPEKLSNIWWSDSHCHFIRKEIILLNFIQWEDEEPTKIDNLLKGV